MDFTMTLEQRLLQDNLARFFSRSRPAAQEGPGREWWTALFNDLGVGELTPGPGEPALHVEQGLVMEALGQARVNVPFLEAVMIGGSLLSRSDNPLARQVLQQTAQGSALPVLAWTEPEMRYDFRRIALSASKADRQWQLSGHKCVVRGGPLATHFLLVARTSGKPGDTQGLSLFLLARDAPGLTLQACPAIDDASVADLTLTNVVLNANALIGGEGQAFPELEHARNVAVAGVCAEVCGALGKMLELTRAHLGTRRQFGQSLSSFQVLQHRLVDMYLHLTKARSASRLATLSLDDEERSSLAASSAQVVVAQACRYIGQQSIQLHGAMGLCDEVDISHYFRRVTVLEREFGDRDFHLARYNALQRRTG